MKLRRIKELTKDSLVYGLGALGTRLVGIVLIPIYTRYLLPADYGILALVTMYGYLAGTLLDLGQHNALFRFWVKYQDDPGRQSRVMATFLILVGLMAIPCVAMAAFARPLAGALLDDGGLWLLLVLVLAINYLDIIQKAPMVVVRANRWTGRYSVFNIVRTAVTMGLVILFVVGLERGVEGILTAQLISGVGFTVLLYLLFMPRVSLGLERSVLGEMLRFGLPLVPGFLLFFVFRFSNRYFLDLFASKTEVGLFSLGNRFGEAIVFLNLAIRTAWPVFLYGSEKDEDAKPLYARAMTYYLAVAGFGAAAVVLFTPEAYRLLVDPRYHASMVIVPVSVVTYILLGVHLFGNVGINLKEKTYYMITISGGATVVSVVLNLLLIPRYGIMGAAAATLAGYAVQAALTLWFSLRIYPVTYEVRRILTLVLVLAGVALAGRVIPWGAAATAVAGKAVLLAGAAPALLAATGFFAPEERRKIRVLFGRLVPGRS